MLDGVVHTPLIIIESLARLKLLNVPDTSWTDSILKLNSQERCFKVKPRPAIQALVDFAASPHWSMLLEEAETFYAAFPFAPSEVQ